MADKERNNLAGAIIVAAVILGVYVYQGLAQIADAIYRGLVAAGALIAAAVIVGCLIIALTIRANGRST